MKNTGTVTRFGCNFNVLSHLVQHFSYLGETTKLATEEHPEVTDIENCLSCINVMLYIAYHIEACMTDITSNLEAEEHPKVTDIEYCLVIH